jgi:hypothetical protein
VAQSTIPDASEPVPFPTIPIESDIRKRLRQWEIENRGTYVPLETINETKGIFGGVLNSSTGQAGMDLESNNDERADEEDNASVFEQDELVDVGTKRTFLLPGDLVELR